MHSQGGREALFSDSNTDSNGKWKAGGISYGAS